MSLQEKIIRDVRLASALARALPNILRARPGQSYTTADALADVIKANPHRTALVFQDEEMTYNELDRASNQVARWAQAQDLRMGDVVALLMENRLEFVVCWLGLAKIGVVTALINTNLTGRPLAHSLGVSKAKHLVLHAALADNFANAKPGLEEELTVWASGGEVEDSESLDDIVAGQSSKPLPADVRRGLMSTDKLFYIYTSGTTGLPKAANFSHQKFITTSSAALGMTRYTAKDRIYIVLPLYHTAGGVMALGSALLAGATAVLARKFSASRFWEDCARYKVTAFQYIGELCRYLLNSPQHPDEKNHQLRICVGNGLRGEIWEPFQDRFNIPRIIEFYGATEGNFAVTNLDNKVGSIGRMPGLLRRAAGLHIVKFNVAKEDVIRGSDGYCIECDLDEAGEAIGRITDTARFEGYSDKAASEKKILRDVFEKGDQYFRTGDLLRLDSEDFFYFVDRIGDTFRWKGENVSTGEVGEVVTTCPGVQDVNIYGVAVPGADGRAGMASIVAGEGFDLASFYDEVCGQLAAYSRPLFLRMLPEVEITGTFKHRKIDAVAEGFDPAKVSDPLYVLDAKAGAYIKITDEVFARIQSGELRL